MENTNKTDGKTSTEQCVGVTETQEAEKKMGGTTFSIGMADGSKKENASMRDVEEACQEFVQHCGEIQNIQKPTPFVFGDIQEKINKLNPMQMSDEDIEFCADVCQDLYQQDKRLFDISIARARQLGMGGLWRGCEAVMLIIANTIQMDRYEQKAGEVF